MSRSSLISPLSLGAAFLAPLGGFAGAATPDAHDRPNILIILSDDMGYSDVGAYGGEIRTPTLDRLAAGGKQFTQFYNAARCCPSRASLLTGLYPHQAGIGHLIHKTPHPGYGDFLAPESITIAEVLREAGYSTYMSGKWHMAPRGYDPERDVEHWPTRRGFDKFYGTIAGSGSFWDPSTLCRDETFITPENDPEYQPERFYYTDAITDNALAFLEQHEEPEGDKPFFLYMAYTAPHWPLHAPEESIGEYEGRYDDGYEAIHRQRVERLRELELVPEVGDIADPVGDWDEVNDKRVESALMETYAAMITRMDEGIGRVVEFLQSSGQLDNTLIFYLHDNGACAEDWFGMERAHTREYEPMGPDQRQRSYRPVQTRDGRPVRMGHDVEPGPADTYTAYKENWANVSNAPFRKYKHYVHEGGISTPLIVHWPEQVASNAAERVVRDPAHLIDVMATCLDAARVQPPTTRNNVELRPLEGISLLPVLKGSGALKRSQPLFWEHESNRAVRDGRWKLVSLEAEPWELYNMERDRGETTNVAAVYPRVVARLAGEWYAWAERAQVLPLGGWTDRNDDATNLHLRQGEALAVGESPLLAGRGVNVAAKVLEGPVNGVILAQGSEEDGFALYAEDESLALVMRRNGQLRRLELENLPEPPFTIRAGIAPRGRAILGIDDRRVDAGLGGGFAANPTEGLSAGFDAETAVGQYPSQFPFEGKLGFITVRGETP